MVRRRLIAAFPHAAGLQLRNNVLQVRVPSCWRRACSGWIQVERTLGDTQQLGDGATWTSHQSTH